MALAERTPIWLRAVLGVWLMLGALLAIFEELQVNTSLSFRILVGAPFLVMMLGLSFYMAWLTWRSLAKMLRRSPASDYPLEDDPEAQYRAGLISHPEMMKRLSLRGFEDYQGFNFIFTIVLVGMALALWSVSSNADGSVETGHLTAALAMLGGGSLFLLIRGVHHRPIKWACWTFVVIAAVGVPVGLLSLALQ